MADSKLARAIEQAALDCGFDKCGIISPIALSGFDKRLKDTDACVEQEKEH